MDRRMGSSSFWILSAKALFISIGAASTAVFLKISVPLVAEFVVYQLPLLWSSVLSWLRPPYLYIVINAIIVSIAASSKLHRTGNHDTLSPLAAEENVSDDGLLVTGGAFESEEADLGNVPVGRSLNEDSTLVPEIEGDEEEFVISRSTWMPAKRPGSMVQEYLPHPSDKPLASSRFVHRKPTKSSPDGGKALKVLRPNRLETKENTWKAITEGRRTMPLTRHRRKSDVSENGIHHQAHLSSQLELQKMRKSETFRDRTNEKEESQVVRRAISPSRDELNRRVEAFIRKFNEEMRLQRQESLKNYKQIIRSSSDH